MLGFVESPRRPGGDNERQRPLNPPVWVLAFMGCLLINTVTFSFIPMGQIVSLEVSVLFLALVVLPLLFLAIYLASKFGYGMLFAGFLSVPGAVVSVMVLGDFFGILTHRNFVENISVRESVYYPTAKILLFKNPILLEDKLLHVVQSLSEKPISSTEPSLPATYSLVPIVDSDYQNSEKIASFAVCVHTGNQQEDCGFTQGWKGGFQVSEPLRLFLRASLRRNGEKLGIDTWDSPVFIHWVADPKERILTAGYLGLAMVLFLNLFWMGAVYLYHSLQKND